MLRRTAVMGLASTPLCNLAQPERFPSRPIRVLHGFAAGGNADAIARIVCEPLGHALKQPLVVDPRPGAGGSVASDVVRRSPPDGYTLLLLTGAHSVSAAFRPSAAAQATVGFTMVSTINQYPFSVIARADSRFTSFEEILKEASQRPGEITFGSAGVGSTQHLAGELIASRAGIRLKHVPYRGGAAMMSDLLAGEIDFGVDSPVAGLPHIRAGKLVALAVTRRQRWRLLPNVPTAEEAGVPGVNIGSWSGMVAPRGIPGDIAKLITEQLHAVLAQSVVRGRLEELGTDVMPSTPVEMRDLISTEISQWTEVIRRSGLELSL